MALLIILHKVLLTFESVDEILKCDHSNEATEQYFPVVLVIFVFAFAFLFVFFVFTI